MAENSHKAEPVLAIGDLHGRLDLLQELLQKLVPQLPPATRLVFLGDYIDRGPGSAQVVDLLIDLQASRPNTILLMGNHEQSLLRVLKGFDPSSYLYYGGDMTLKSYGCRDVAELAQQMPAKHLAFFNSLALCWQNETHIFVHAGLKPGLPLEEQTPRELLWIRDEFIFCPDFQCPKTVVFGHTPFPRPLLRPQRIGIDTGAVYGNYLTCLELPGQIFHRLPEQD